MLTRIFPYHRFTLLKIAILLLASPISGAKTMADDPWIEVTSPNFVFRSNGSVEDVKKLAYNLEAFRAAVSLITNARNLETDEPLNIIVLKDSRSLTKLGMNPNIAGFFLSGLRDDLVVMRGTKFSDTRTLLHEYVHYMMRNHSSLGYPMWYREGFAEYLGAANIVFDEIRIGLGQEDTTPALRWGIWISMERLLQADRLSHEWNTMQNAMFYAQSWAVVHYLQNRRSKRYPFRESMFDYIKRIESGESELTAFEGAFGLTHIALNKKVKHYLGKGRFKYIKIELDRLLPDVTLDASTLPRHKAALELGQIALLAESYDDAKMYYELATEDEATHGEGLAGMGGALMGNEHTDQAKAYFLEALALTPNNPYRHLDMANYWLSQAKNTDHQQNKAEFFKLAQAHYVKAWKLDKTIPETYVQYADTFLQQGVRYEKALELLREADYLSPGHHIIRARLAEAYLGAGQIDDARKAANLVSTLTHGGGESTNRAKAVLDQIEVKEKQHPLKPLN
ncbi:MAG: tetratricopeptide repeat protein [Pseudomonadota bacterium]